MIAGTLRQLEQPTDDALESAFPSEGEFPAFDVRNTQTSFDDRPIQTGLAATSVMRRKQVPMLVGQTQDDRDTMLITEPEERSQTLVTEWAADVTGTGLVAAESVDGDGKYDFPFGLLSNLTGGTFNLLAVDVEGLHIAWDDEDTLGDVWMTSADSGAGTSIDYHDNADKESRPTIGLGFECPWGNVVMRGVIYESGYIAVYNDRPATEFFRFIEEEILEFTEVIDDEVGQKQLGEATEESAGDEPEVCNECGRESSSIGAILPGLCIVCGDKKAEEVKEGGDAGN